MIDEPPHKTEYRPDIDKGGPGGFPAHSAGETLAFGFRGRCPRCGEGRLFTGYLKITDRCDVCGLGFAGHDVGDGPVVPMILVVGGLVVGLAWMVEVAFQPPLWVHAALWGPLTLALSLGLLPILKGISRAPAVPVALHRRRAEAGRRLSRAAASRRRRGRWQSPVARSILFAGNRFLDLHRLQHFQRFQPLGGLGR